MKACKQIEKTIVTKMSTHTCDICGTRTLEEDNSWNIGAKLEYYEYLGLLGGTKTTIVDVCMHCMQKDVMPLICKTFNITPRIEK